MVQFEAFMQFKHYNLQAGLAVLGVNWHHEGGSLTHAQSRLNSLVVGVTVDTLQHFWTMTAAV